MANVVQQKSDSSNVFQFWCRVDTVDQANAVREKNLFFLITSATHSSFIRASQESDCKSELSPAFSPFNAFHTVNSENHSSLCVTLKLPVFPEVFHYPQPNLRLHPSRWVFLHVHQTDAQFWTNFWLRAGKHTEPRRRQRLMIRDSECLSAPLRNEANFIILWCSESHYHARVIWFPFML